jgi:hypothetical protein
MNRLVIWMSLRLRYNFGLALIPLSQKLYGKRKGRYAPSHLKERNLHQKCGGDCQDDAQKNGTPTVKDECQ